VLHDDVRAIPLLPFVAGKAMWLILLMSSSSVVGQFGIWFKVREAVTTSDRVVGAGHRQVIAIS
jgi:hypothetical protein